MTSNFSLKGIEKVISEHLRMQKISISELNKERIAKLNFLVEHHYENNRIYRKMLDDRGVHPNHIKTLKDIEILPIITSKDILDNEDEFFTTPNENVTFLHTSGSTGKPKIIPVAEREKERIFLNDALTGYIAGIRGNGINYCTYPCGPWPSSFFAQNGGEMVGPTVRADMNLPIDWHYNALSRFKPTYIMASPSYISFFASELEKKGVDLKKIGVKIIKLAGEPFSDKFREKIEHAFNATVMDIYGCAEIGAASSECEYTKRNSQHHVLAHELIIETRKIGSENEMLPHGERGEMIITPLFRTSIPIIRYAMKDIISTYPIMKCECGLNLPNMSRISGRVDDMMTYGGANVYSEMFYKVLSEYDLDDKFRVTIKKDNDGLKDQMLITIENDEVLVRHNFDEVIQKGLCTQSSELKNSFNIGIINPVKVEFVEKGRLYKSGGKFKRFVDER